MPVTLTLPASQTTHTEATSLSPILKDNETVKVNNARLGKLIMGDSKEEVMKLSWKNKIFLSHTSHNINKQHNMEKLHDVVNQNRFQQLIQQAPNGPLNEGTVTPLDRLNAIIAMQGSNNEAQFHLKLISSNQSVELYIDGEPVEKRSVDVKQFKQMEAQLGKVSADNHDYQYDINLLNQYLVEDQQKTTDEGITEKYRALTDQDFAGGGVNKRFDKSTGVLKGMNQTAVADFKLETELASYARGDTEAGVNRLSIENQQGLSRYISLQEQIDPKFLPGVDENGQSQLDLTAPYAQVTMYKREGVKTAELDLCLPNPVFAASSNVAIQQKALPEADNALTLPQRKEVASQLVDLLRVMYNSQISHRDLHSHNLLVHKVQEGDSTHVMLKAIDFGRAEFGHKSPVETTQDIEIINDDSQRVKSEHAGGFDQHKYEDILYIFNKQGVNKAETFARNQLLPSLINPTNPHQEAEPSALQAKVAKHYPLHNLLPDQGGVGRSTEMLLSNIGTKLVSSLQSIEALKAADTFDDAFYQLKVNEAFHEASMEVENAFSSMKSVHLSQVIEDRKEIVIV